MRKEKEALIVFAKVPKPNEVKTRLTTMISPESAAQLYEAFLLDAIEAYAALPVAVRLYFSAPPAEVPGQFQPQTATLHEQKGNGLGERMATAFAETFVEGFAKAVIIGTDHPTLPLEFIEHAFLTLNDSYSVVIGPSEDGGYYALGMNEFYPELFRDMAYSHEDVFAQTVQRAETTSATLHVLPRWYDVDTPEALTRLLNEIDGSELSLVRTRQVLNDIATQYPALIS